MMLRQRLMLTQRLPLTHDAKTETDANTMDNTRVGYSKDMATSNPNAHLSRQLIGSCQLNQPEELVKVGVRVRVRFAFCS